MPCYLKLRRLSRKKMNFWKWFRTAVGCPFILLLLKVVWILFLYGILRSANQLIKETYQPWTVNWICNYQLWFIIRKRRLSKHLTAPQILFWKYDVMWCYLMWLFCEYVSFYELDPNGCDLPHSMHRPRCHHQRTAMCLDLTLVNPMALRTEMLQIFSLQRHFRFLVCSSSNHCTINQSQRCSNLGIW